MTYTPKKTPTARRLAFLFILTGFVLMALSSFLPYKAVFQLIAIALLVAGLQVLVRYVLSDYRYIIDDRDNGTSDLLVFKKQGKKDVKLCHVSIFCIESIDKSAKKNIADKKYNYVQNPLAETYSVVFLDGDKRCEVILECGAEFAAAVNCRMGGENIGGTTFAM